MVGRHKLQPTGFKSVAQVADVAIEINFAREDEARRFERTFRQVAQTG
jgi:hypothetical protein